MKDLTDKILKEIKSKEIKPISRNLFLLKNYGFWTMTFLFVVLGSLSISLLSYNIASKDWDIYSRLHESWLGFIVSSLPYLWIAMAMASLIIAVLNFEHSKKGYKHAPIQIILFSVAVSLVLGLGGYALGFGQQIDNFVGETFSSYSTVESQKSATWNQPDKGLFSGVIQSAEKDTFRLEDLSGRSWTVDFSAADIRGNTKIQPGVRVKIVGDISEGSNINAVSIRPWGNMMNGRGNGHGRNSQ